MLESKYANIIWGKSYLSVLFGILKIKFQNRKEVKKTLLIDSDHSRLGKLWTENIGEIEKNIFQHIGQKYSIAPLIEFESYLEPVNTLVVLDEKLIEFGPSPFANIREISKKLPDCFSSDVFLVLDKYGEEDFNNSCFQFFDEQALKPFNSKSTKSFVVTEPGLKVIFDEFLNYLNQKRNTSKQFYYVLQVLFQTCFSNLKSDEGAMHLLTAILSPRYKIDQERLLKNLIFEFKSLGGDTVESGIESFEIYRNSLEYIKLESFDGIVDLDQLFLFSKIKEMKNFEHQKLYQIFNSIKLCTKVKHEILDFYKEKRILFSREENLGTDFPHFEIYISKSGELEVTYAYAYELGTKASFFYKKVEKEVYLSLCQILPGLELEEFLSSCELSDGLDFWNQVGIDTKKRFNDISSEGQLLAAETQDIVKSIEYFGPFRTQSMGLYSYLWDFLES